MSYTVAIDPGDHIGIVWTSDGDNKVHGLTFDGEHRLEKLWMLFECLQPKTVVYERFALRANAAQKLVGSTFITCEVIGVIKLYCQLNNIEPIGLLPSCKEYCGFSSNPKDPKFKDVHMYRDEKITEHTRDAYRLYKYYKLFGDKIK